MAGKLTIKTSSGLLCFELEVTDLKHGLGLGGITSNQEGWSELHENFAVSNQQIVHKPLQLVKRVDAMSPRLMQALLDYQVLDTVEIIWSFVNPESEEVEFDYRIELHDAQIIYIEPFDFSQKGREPEEKLVFSYREITWRYLAKAPEEGEFFNEAASDGVF
jgi:type VI secretion system Hcp family effector